MKDPNLEKIYNITLSVFLGIMLTILFNELYTRPKIINVYLD